MKIKRLEIHGFKSFVDKVSFDFTAGVTAIVGPNGCGKSNVVDAIRWVMGEQSAKNLRGRAMEDVIFGGSEFRKALGMAEVSLIFSAEDGRVPAKYLNYAEIQVTRRLYRDGESEYLLNKTPCRLMDIAELFMDTGVGAKAYSIIEQGKIGMILMSKPEERRFLIEEAAGVTKFKARKQVALKKIETTRQNLLRLSDIIGELRRQLSALQRQAKKAEKFRELREELKRHDLAIAARQFATLDQERTREEAAQAVADRQATQLEQAVSTGELELERRQLLLAEAEKSLSETQEKIFTTRGGVQAAEQRIEFQRKELQSLERRLVQAHEDQLLLQRQHEEAMAEHAQLLDRRASFASDTVGEGQQLQERELQLEEMLVADAAQARHVDEVRRNLFSIQAEIARQTTHLTATGRRIQAVQEKSERLNRERLGYAERYALSIERVQQADTAIIAQQTGLNTLRLSLQDLTLRDEELKRVVIAHDQELQTQRIALNRAEARLHSLQKVATQFEGFSQGVKRLLTATEFTGSFAGLVADFLETAAEHEVVLETVLGERLQYLVGADDSRVGEAIAFLREQKGGRCTFLPQPLTVPAAIVTPTGTVPLLDLVDVRPQYVNCIRPLLINIFVVDDLVQAIGYARQHPLAVFVTRQGDLAHGGGIVAGGSTEAAQSGIIHTKREIKEYGRLVAELSAALTELSGRRESLAEETLVVSSSLQQTRQDVHAAELQLLSMDKELQRGRDELAHLAERLGVIEHEEQQLAEERVALEREMVEAEEQRSQGEVKRVGLDQGLIELQQQGGTRKTQLELLRQEVTELKVRAAALLEKQEATSRATARIDAILADISSRRATQEALASASGAERETLEAELAQGNLVIAGLLRQQHDAEAAAVQNLEQHAGAASLVAELTEQLKGLRGQLEEARRERSRSGMQLSELAIKTARLESLLLEKYRLTIPELLVQLHDSEAVTIDESRRLALQSQIEELGEVNLTAIEQYQELEGRHDFLADQKGDLEESLRSLQQAIQRINRTTRKRFLETFALVNEKFKEIFPRLFCGGSAELRLTNEDDLLETGIEIIVQPPGKKLQNVSLLSGGEKALTAVALIFSIFLIKPSPFCLLDEVDAPLDDANIGRFNDIIREMTTFSQFILITHSKTTMAVADTLYGVTMEEPGVSKLVSVKLN